MAKYDFRKIEKKWQKVWAKNKYKIWAASDHPSSNIEHKAYILDMFPYPSGEGLHVGHVEGYTASDIYSRFSRMNGLNVLHPMGWDAFGLPAENYAIKTKTHPVKVVKKNVERFRDQLNSLGFSYDWQREVNTTDPNYYRWTQWIFLQLFKKGLAYEAEIPVNWCPQDKTVLANEEVVEGCCERCGTKVERKKLKQWILKITAYADRLLKDLEGLDWPERVKEMQRNWIGRSEGALIKFHLVCDRVCTEDEIEVFTTRPDTIAGATYLVLAPEHLLIKNLESRIMNYEEVRKYAEKAKNKSERERLMLDKAPTLAKGEVGVPTEERVGKKTGVVLKGIKATNPWNGKEIPVWISDYVLAHYGTGAIMAVPQHDERDREFAEKFQLPIANEPLIPKDEAISKTLGEKTINYKLRDWVFSRQRYWGEPIPIIKCEKCGNQPVPEEELPVALPKVKNYEPTGEAESPLAAIKKWVKVKCPKCGGKAKRETNTMPQWAGSCWYYLAYLLGAKNLKIKAENLGNENFKKLFDYWMPVDLYVGGVEHAVLHLLYARFWHKFLFDIGVVSTTEPFQKLVNQGLILGPDGQKMSKSKGNVVNPDDMIKEFGADSLRMYEMFMGPLGDSKPWDPRGIVGLHRFLGRIYKLCSKIEDRNDQNVQQLDQSANWRRSIISNLDRLLHQTIKKITEDIQSFKFNTAISALMILVNEIEKLPELKIENWQLIIKLLFPFAPHLAQELWTELGNKTPLDYESWPTWDEKLIAEEEFELLVQINGRLRAKFMAKRGISEDIAKTLALTQPEVKKWLEGKQPKKAIFVKDRLLNLII